MGRIEGAAVKAAEDRGEQTVPADDSYREAMTRAGRLLTARPRTERELSERLVSAGFDPSVVAGVLDRLRRLDLVDDREFARRWIAERGGKKGRAVLIGELESKGVGRETAEEAFDGGAPDQAAAATRLAEVRVRRVAHLPMQVQAARLYGFLARRGFCEEAAEEAVKAVLPPEGWD